MSGWAGRRTDRDRVRGPEAAPARPPGSIGVDGGGSVLLRSADLAGLQEASRILLSPLDYPAVDDWRSAATAALRELLRADRAAFLLPIEGMEPLCSEEIGLHYLRDYLACEDTLPRDAGVCEEQLDQEAWARRSVSDGTLPDLRNTAYWREFVAPLWAYDTLEVTVPLEGGARPATLFFHHERPDGRKFGPRERSLLRLLHPALAAGVATWRRVEAWSERMVALVDALPVPLQLRDARGREMYRNRALRELLEADPERHRLETALKRMAERLGTTLSDRTAGSPPDPGELATRSVETSRGLYHLAAALVRPETLGGRGPVRDVLLTVRGPGLRLPGPGAVEATTPLTRRESEVALLLALRRTNREIASALVISPHTARRHTERVLRKLGLRSRRDVRGAIREAVEQEGGLADPPG